MAQAVYGFAQSHLIHVKKFRRVQNPDPITAAPAARHSECCPYASLPVNVGRLHGNPNKCDLHVEYRNLSMINRCITL
jgi:hypothetical protein